MAPTARESSRCAAKSPDSLLSRRSSSRTFCCQTNLSRLSFLSVVRRNDPVEGHVQDDDPELDAAPPPELHRPMQGVKFARMTGPGKSGFRPEHISAMLRNKKRRAVNGLSKAISEAETMALNGTLPPAGWSWIMDSPLCIHCQESKHSS